MLKTPAKLAIPADTSIKTLVFILENGLVPFANHNMIEI
jgi:hypothetical protein